MQDIPTFNMNILRRIVLRVLKEMHVKHTFIKNLLEYNSSRKPNNGKTFTYYLLFDKDLSNHRLLLIPYVDNTDFIRLNIFSLAIQGGFIWAESKEGMDFWRKIDNKFIQIAHEFIDNINFSQTQPYKIITKS